MSTWPDTDGKTVDRYLSRLRLRYPISRTYYRQALRSFQDVAVRQRSQSLQITQETLKTWLSERALVWARSTLLHRACIVNRFLDYLVKQGLIVSNPVADLRAKYNAKSDKAILRALFAPDPDQALEALQQLPPFGSVLGDMMRNHIALMRTRGYRYQTQAGWLRRFDRFLQEHPQLSGESVSVMLQHWAAAQPTANHAAECERLARVLAKAQHHLDPMTKPRAPITVPHSRWSENGDALTSTVHRRFGVFLISLGPTPLRGRRYAPLASTRCWSWPIVQDCGWGNSLV
jgi:integrase/recombinase XerD